MTDVPTAPLVPDEPAGDDTQEPKGTPIVPDEVSEWGNDLTFTEPNAKTETGKDVNRTSQDDEPAGDDKDPADTDEEDNPTKVPTTPPVPHAVPTAVQDPGVFTPQDYSFDMLIKGKSTKITTPEEADALAADPENFETPQELMQFMRLSQKMENGIERDKAAWQQAKTSFDTQQEAEQARLEQIDTIAAEMNYLQQRGDLPPIDDTYKDANWSDPMVAKQPGVREQLALLTYMDEENARREAAGLKSKVSVLDAYNGWQIEVAKAKADKDNKTAGTQRKNAGSKVQGSGPAPISNRPKGIAVGRVMGNLNDLGANWN